MQEAVRLVIWDLDDTFWRGTLTEGGIKEYVQAHHETVLALVGRGIMNSICSKNDFGAVRDILKSKGIWEYFVFPSIDWNPKGCRVRHIVEAVQLRPETILFIDDNHGNRAEVQAEMPSIQVSDEKIISTMLIDARFAGKDDKGLTRLQHYKLLEQRSVEMRSFGKNNHEFLRQSGISVSIEMDIASNIDRAIELINRTNQLNFTKNRLSDNPQEAAAQLTEELTGFDVRVGLVSVRDRFGDYGFCGFFLLKGHWGTSKLIHFSFSCRVLGMGVEQWMFHRLGKPAIEIRGEVSADLTFDPDWINSAPSETEVGLPTSTPQAVRIRGGCELEIIQHFFKLNSSRLSSEVVVCKSGMIIPRHHSALLYQSLSQLSTIVATILSRFGFDEEDVKSGLLDSCDDNTLLIYNNSTDASIDAYKHKTLDLILPVWIPGLGHIDEQSEEDIDDYLASHSFDEGVALRIKTIREMIVSDFVRVSVSDEPTYRKIYRDIARKVPPNALLVWVLPVDTYIGSDGHRMEHPTQRILNSLVREESSSLENIVTLEFSSLLAPDETVSKKDGHYDRAVYYRLYRAICDQYAIWLNQR